MLSDVLEALRARTLSTSGVTVDRTFVVTGPDWAVENCRQLVVWLNTVRPEYPRGPDGAPVQGLGIAGPACGPTFVYDVGVGLYVNCQPAMNDHGHPARPDDISAWSLGFVDEVQAVAGALADLDLSDLGAWHVMGSATPSGPNPGGGVAGYRFPLSLHVMEGMPSAGSS